jgi:hypothetical protein
VVFSGSVNVELRVDGLARMGCAGDVPPSLLTALGGTLHTVCAGDASPQPFSFLSGTAGTWQPAAAQVPCHCTYTTAATEAVVKEAMLSMRAHFDGNVRLGFDHPFGSYRRVERTS